MKIRIKDRAEFRADKMAKIALATTSRTQLDLYCLEPNQEQKPHAHADQDKIEPASSSREKKRSSSPAKRSSPQPVKSTGSGTRGPDGCWPS